MREHMLQHTDDHAAEVLGRLEGARSAEVARRGPSVSDLDCEWGIRDTDSARQSLGGDRADALEITANARL